MKPFLNNFTPLFLAAGLTTSFAQNTDLPPLPSGPLPREAAGPMAWEVTYEYRESDSNGSGPKTADSPVDPSASIIKPKRTNVTRSGQYIREQTSWEDDTKTESYVHHGLKLSLIISSGEAVFSLPGRYAPDYVDYTKGSFPEFSWLSPARYVGIQKIDGRDCFIFKAKSSELPSTRQPILGEADLLSDQASRPEPEKLLTAAIDTSTLRPVFLDDGETRRSYQMLEAPAGPLTIPPAIETKMREWVQRIEESARQPSPP